MSWQSETQLRDLDAGDRLHLTCLDCGHGWYREVAEWTARRPHADLYVDEVPTIVRCPRFGCGSRRMRIARPFPGETEAFVGGMP